MNVSMRKKESKMNISIVKKKIYRIADKMYNSDVWKISNIECNDIWTNNNISKTNEIPWEKQIDQKKTNEHWSSQINS